MAESEEKSITNPKNKSIQYYPLTHPQKAMWYTEKVHPGTSIGNVVGMVKFKGEIDYNLLEKSLNLFIEKNDAMRMRVFENEGEPYQYIAEYHYYKPEMLDFSGKPIEELYKWDEKATRMPFKLVESDLFYFALIKIDEHTGGIYAKLHHLISDAWTMVLTTNQIIENYTRLKKNIEIPKDKNPSYVEYISSEQEYEKSERYQKDKEYWNSNFEVIPDQIALKAADARNIDIKARRKTMLVPKKLTAKMHEYCLENRTSVFVLFVAALSMYLNRITANEHIILGTTTLNRANKREKETVGMFSNISCMQVALNDTMNFKALTTNISRESLSLLRHQKYPYHLVLKEVREKHKITHDLFDIVLNYQNSKYDKSGHSEDYVTRWYFNGYQSNNLIIHINDREDEGHLIIDYDYLIDLFHAKEIEFIHQHIINLLWHALDDSSKKISELEILSEKEKHKILYEFDNKKIIYPENKVIDSLSEEIGAGKGYILDKNLNLMPIGIAGELYISISDDSLTTAKEVIENPYEPGKKLYKTDHMARWFPEGDIEYKHRKEKKKKAKEIHVKIVSTFTAEPIQDYIEWWGKKFGYHLKTEFAGYNQVFQELLNPDSILSKNKEGINIILVRFEDFIRNDNGTEQQKIAKLEQVFEELIQAVSKFDNPVPLITAVFPVSTHIGLSHNILTKINNLNNQFPKKLSEYKNIYAVDLRDTQEMYSIQEVFDSIKDKEGHMPFAEEYYAAIGTQIARKICAIKKQHFKVIVLDCDNTLWKGICGEQGALGVKVRGGYKIIQEFLLQKSREGFLLAISSKNNEKDVIEAFETNPEMILRKNDIASWRVNWEEKSQNIKEIAKELNLGLDSFIYLDDSSIECLKMVENCPEVLTLQLPSKEELIPLFLKHVWAFDRENITKEDALRTSMYEAEKKRKEIKDTGVSLEDFIRNLGIKVSMRLILSGEISRAAQMTQRTNQFNLSTIRRSEEEISRLIQDKKTKCFVIEAADRFGDYGLIGLAILKNQGSKLFIDTFLLSCRILGRRVEDAVLSGIRRFAEEIEIREIEADYIPTEKNKPILNFIKRLQWSVVKKDEKHTEYKALVSDLPKQIEHIEFYYNQAYQKSHEAVQASEPEGFAVFDHVAIAVKNMKEAEEYYKLLGYKITSQVYDQLQNSYLSMCISNKYLPIELVAPVNEKSPSYDIAETHGEIPYHLCYRVSNIKSFLERIQDIEYDIVSDEKPAVLFGNQKVAFIRVKKVGLIELLETGAAINSANRNNSFRNNAIKLLANDFEKAVSFYRELGYTLERSIKDIEKNLFTAKLTGHFGETIDLVTPLSKDSVEHEFLKQHGAGVYQINFRTLQKDYMKFSQEDSKFLSMNRGYLLFHKKEENEAITLAEYDLCDTKILEKVKLKEYILPIAYFTGRKLLKLPIFEGINYNESNYEAPRNKTEEILAQIWEQILKTKKVGIDDDFFELGGDSLHAIQLQVNLLKYNWNLTTQDIYKYRTIRQLSNVIINIDKNGTENAIEGNVKEGVAAKDIKAQIISISKKDMEYSNILLVGATGYLGAHILNELLISTESNIYCLVRAKTNNDAKERLKDTFEFYFGNKYTSVIDKRVFTVRGDITLEHFGLGQNEYIHMQKKIDAAIHAGALVSYYGDYSNFEEINIRGTEKVIKFCQEGNKPLLYTSTMGISGQYLVATKDENKVKMFTENDLYIGQNYFDNPYVRSKYEAEILVNKYIEAGAKIAVLRVGNLTGRFTDGHFQKNITQNAFYNIMKSIISIGAVSKNILNEAFDFTPVDYCSKAIVKILMKEESLGGVFHLYNHNRSNVSEIIKLLGKIGIEIKCLERDEFKQLIRKVTADESMKNNLKGIINDFDEESQLKFSTSVKLDSQITVSYLKQLGFEWPSINAEYMQKIINYMKKIKYIS
ncbi:MAG: thioester reductase domain-containing protein [Deltaproteobacteria bacterium]